MTFVRKAGLATAAAALGASLAGMSTPAFAGDSGWGCGGPCATEAPEPPSDDSGDTETDNTAGLAASRTSGAVSYRFADSGWGCGGQC
ncbi:hypothetical protein GCM10023340_03670 [Nocardioides marinquilinus]|uniref:Uncharacterized protein n=1 Tax=Nocardioides marinquilinus TaxID=1210400 RepID=A0ABP9P9X2_9ACTN